MFVGIMRDGNLSKNNYVLSILYCKLVAKLVCFFFFFSNMLPIV